jgi:hypothetical protein
MGCGRKEIKAGYNLFLTGFHIQRTPSYFSPNHLYQSMREGEGEGERGERERGEGEEVPRIFI